MSEVQIIENQGIEVFEAQERANIDIQVATAKRYPRDLMRVKNNSIAIACMDVKTAQSCRFAKPVGGKHITGPSVHLARIVCQQYGNIRVQQRIKQINHNTIVAEAVAFDMETNYAVCVEARRSILDRNGNRYAESVVETNAMAILAIAERNAILKVIPKAITDSVYNEAFKFANGDLSDETKLITARKKAFEWFASEHGATEEEVLALLGLKVITAVKAEHIADLRGFMQSLVDKEVTSDELFKRHSEKAPEKKPTITEKELLKAKKDGNSLEDLQGEFEITPEQITLFNQKD